MAMSMFIFSSCNEVVDDNLTADNENVTSIRSSPCGPPILGCTAVVTQDYTYTNGSCIIIVNMVMTKCTTNGETTYFFEDNNVSFSTNGNCQNLEDEVELAYDEFIEFNIDIATGQESVDCSQGVTVSSKHIKNECTRLCEGPKRVGQTDSSFRWVSCSDEQGCCITTVRWCYEDDELIFSEPMVSDNTIGCIPSTPNCNPTNDPFQEIVPCGGRCDR